MLRFIKSNYPIILIALLGTLLRLYKFDQLFMYNHDNDLASWIIKDIVVDGHLRLIGQETSTAGIFIGGLFYYLQIPFYFLFAMDPLGATFLGVVLGALYIVGIYYIISKIFSKKVGLYAAGIYALSFIFILNDKEIVPTQPVIFWSFALLWSFYEIISGNLRKGFVIFAVLASFIWHINFALVLPIPLIIPVLIMSGRKIKISDFFIPLLVFIVLSLPLLMFEYRHGFIQTDALVKSLTTDQKDIVNGWEKISRTFHLISKNYYSIILPSSNFIKYEHVFVIFFILLVYFWHTLKSHRKIFLLMILWFLVYYIFFSLYSKRLSEYYLNSIQFIPVILLSLLLDQFIRNDKFRKAGTFVIVILLFTNMFRLFTLPINKSGYLERKAVIKKIKDDANIRGYRCVSVSYITSPGNNLGYRYLIWMEGLKTKKINEYTPVYTIVFPLNEKLFPVDETFGAIGLIYPDYTKYNIKTIELSCEGEDDNVTGTMFGFTK